MKKQTIRRLNELNRLFYEQIAVDFSSTRNYAWPSWKRFLAASTRVGASFPQQELRAVDIGCGNGRFSQWLTDQGQKFSYVGLDNNPQLLEQARHRYPRHRFLSADIVELLLQGKPLVQEQFDLATLFGIFHHVPGNDLRHGLLAELSRMLRPGGEVWLTAWIPNGTVLDPKKIAQRAGFSADELEPGDVFLGWKTSEAVRFAHTIQPGELEKLLEGTGLSIQKSWIQQEKGERNNECFLLQKTR